MTTTAQENLNLENNNRTKKSVKQLFYITIAWLILIIYSIYEVVFVHKFFIHTFFRSTISDVPPPIILKIGYWNKLQFKIILMARYFLKDQFWGQSWLKRVHHRILENLKHQDIDQSQLKMPIPSVIAQDVSSDIFWESYVRTNTPVIIKQGAKDSFACNNWTMEMFQERFGKLKVDIVNQSQDEHKPDVSTFDNVINSRGSGEKLYISFCADIFFNNPELIEELGCLEFKQHMGGNTVIFGGAQLFLATSKGTGTHSHCADGNNLFFQIHGEKKWTFVHPDYLWLMYPMLDKSFLFCASFLKNDYQEDYLTQYAPLQNYCPRYEAVVEPGDVLLIPAWQWHGVDNLTDETIAVATRWSMVKQKRANTFFDFIQLFSPKIWKVKSSLLIKDTNEASLALGERTDDVVQSKDDFVNLGNENKTVPLEFHNWPDEYR